MIYLEDPQIRPLGQKGNEMWPGALGACATVMASQLHQIAAHAMEPPEDLVVVLGGAAT